MLPAASFTTCPIKHVIISKMLPRKRPASSKKRSLDEVVIDLTNSNSSSPEVDSRPTNRERRVSPVSSPPAAARKVTPPAPRRSPVAGGGGSASAPIPGYIKIEFFADIGGGQPLAGPKLTRPIFVKLTKRDGTEKTVHDMKKEIEKRKSDRHHNLDDRRFIALYVSANDSEADMRVSWNGVARGAHYLNDYKPLREQLESLNRQKAFGNSVDINTLYFFTLTQPGDAEFHHGFTAPWYTGHESAEYPTEDYDDETEEEEKEEEEEQRDDPWQGAYAGHRSNGGSGRGGGSGIPRTSAPPRSSPLVAEAGPAPAHCASWGKLPQGPPAGNYRKQLLVFHPDKNHDCEKNATAKFRELQRIFGKLS